MHQTLLSAVSQLGCPNILIVGDYMLDVYIYGDALRISPEAPVPIRKVRNRTHSCGGASSVAADVAALG
ncbi:MAG: bifunctional heptose 7-phosphate kinase/heptose 1-phosphate adenyltransferase, partial [Planctomycetes bacterium]|nr:bifunctional heptose 7-phosphate kinase/heptose 1-phosphate adenyltransferase [Planctomycetota bacterium]